jgi:penicillin-binding protein 2
VQVVNASQYRTSLDRQSMRRVRVSGARGSIYDRNGVCLVDNRPSYCLAIYIEELRQPGRWDNTIDKVEAVIDRATVILKQRREVTRRDIRNHIRRRLPLPFLAWRDIDDVTLARWAEHSAEFPGVDIVIEPVRRYRYGSTGAHVLGYVGRQDLDAGEQGTFHYYLPEMEGKYGIESVFNDALAGESGGRLIRVDASGFKHDEVAEREPRPGADFYVTLDIELQRLAGSLLKNDRGACVVVDPRNGDILALSSAPAFNPNHFYPRISTAAWRRLNSGTDKPLFNRAVTGLYPPGSTFKPLVAIASLENRRTTAATTFGCPGYFQLGETRFHCWLRRGHGRIDLRTAIEQSCNAYFCELGLKCGYDRVYHMADAIGFGRRTGIRLRSEKAGLLPDNTWKVRNYNDRWRSGDTCNVSIGQGALLVTPLQMAMFTATIANGGTVYRPRLLARRQAEGDVRNEMNWSPRTLDVLRGAMHDVIHAPGGTGKRALVEGAQLAGKTGTAEYGPRGARKKYTWMIAFGPYAAPRFAAAMVVEDGESGGRTVAPRMRRLMAGALGIALPPEEGEADA